MKRILLTGARGFVGARIREELSVIEAPSLRGAAEDDVARLIGETEPEVILHTAAISDIGACARDPEGSYHANVELPLYFARHAGGAKLVAFSSDQVYSGLGTPGPYREEEVAAANLYAREKLEMETRVLEANPDAVLLRATWMYDMPLCRAANRGNFLVNLLRAAVTRTPVTFSERQYRGLTYVREVARNMEAAARLPGGVYNFGSENTMSMAETARFFFSALGVEVPVRTPAADAPIPHNLWMDCARARAGGVVFSDTAGGLRRCIEEYSLRLLVG